MICTGILYHIVRVKVLRSVAPPLESVPRRKGFSKIFPNDLPKIPPKQERHFVIDFMSDTQPISIPPYWMDLTE